MNSAINLTEDTLAKGCLTDLQLQWPQITGMKKDNQKNLFCIYYLG